MRTLEEIRKKNKRKDLLLDGMEVTPYHTKNKLHQLWNKIQNYFIKRSLKKFIKKNKEKVYKIAEQNTTRNSKGQVIISKDDPWFYEDEWEEHIKNLEKEEDKKIGQ